MMTAQADVACYNSQVKTMIHRKTSGAGTAELREEEKRLLDRMGKFWEIRRQNKDDAQFRHVEWSGPEFYLKSMKLLLSSSIVSLTFGISLFSEHLGALNLLVALSLAPSLFAIAQTPTVLNMYKCTSAACEASKAPHMSSAHCNNRFERIWHDVDSAGRIAIKQLAKDANWAAAGAVATAVCALMSMQNADNDVLNMIFTHARHDVVHNMWVRHAMIVLGAVEDLPVVLRDNLENMFPRVKPVIKISPMMSQLVRVCSAVQFMD
jgi:hypothetical protein